LDAILSSACRNHPNWAARGSPITAPPPLAPCAERRIQAAIRLAAVEIKEAGGDEALADYLRSTLTTVLAVALAERVSEDLPATDRNADHGRAFSLTR